MEKRNYSLEEDQNTCFYTWKMSSCLLSLKTVVPFFQDQYPEMRETYSL